MLIFMQSRQYLYVASRQGLCNTGKSNLVSLRYILVLIRILHHVPPDLEIFFKLRES